MNSLTVSALQLDLAWENPTENRKKIERMLLNGAPPSDIIVLPEMFTNGFTMASSSAYEEMGGDTHQWLEEMARQYNCLFLGSLIIKENDQYYNRLLAVSEDGLLAQYDKRHLFRMANEDENYTGGTEWVTFEYRGWKICPQICYDLRFPVWSRNKEDAQKQMSYDLLIYVANWPAKRVHHWDTLLKARAIENQAFVVGVNRVGTDGIDIPYVGHTAILSYVGDALAYSENEENLLTATLRPEGIRKYRKSFPVWKDADNFSLSE
ncbi:MAG: amidohydrolase [Bacteroidota bacterium]